jgi:hypothetical protein
LSGGVTGSVSFDGSSNVNITTTITGGGGSSGGSGGNPFSSREDLIINGDFGIWQRGISFIQAGYTADRWRNSYYGGNSIHTQQKALPGDTLAGNNINYFLRHSISGQNGIENFAVTSQYIEGVRSYAGQTITVLGWARRSSGSGNMAIELTQIFGTGGMPSTRVNISPVTISLTESFAPFAATFSVPSISGKTIGENRDDCLGVNFWMSSGSGTSSRTNSLGAQVIGVDLWGIHIRYGALTTAAASDYKPRDPNTELMLCKRYFQKVGAGLSGYEESPTQTSIAIPVQTPLSRKPVVTLPDSRLVYRTPTALSDRTVLVQLDKTNKTSIGPNGGILFVNQYPSISSPGFYVGGWDLTSVSYSSKSLSLASNINITDIAFTGDGVIVYLFDYNQRKILQYTLLTPQDISTAVYSREYSFNTQPSESGRSFAINPNGTTMYYVHAAKKTIDQYTLSTPADISTASYTGKSFGFANQTAGAIGITFSDDGSKMYLGSSVSGNQNFYQYTLSTPWEINTAQFTTSFNTLAQDSLPVDIEFNDTGTRMFILGQQGQNPRVLQYTLSTPWNISTASYNKSFNISAQTGGSPFGITFAYSGSKLFAVAANSVFQYNVDTAEAISWNLDLFTYANMFDATPQVTQGALAAISFDDTGSILYILNITDNSHGKILQYTLSTPWNVNSATYTGVSFINVTTRCGMFFKPGGNTMYTLDASGVVYEYDLFIPWNIGSVSYSSRSFNANVITVSRPNGVLQGYLQNITFSTGGTKMYITDQLRIYQYDLSTAWDITTASYISSFVTEIGYSFGGGATTFKSDGTKMYVCVGGDPAIVEFTLSTPWEINTVSYSEFFYFAGAGNYVSFSAQGVFFKSNGNKMYLVNGYGNPGLRTIAQFNIPNAEDPNESNNDYVGGGISGRPIITKDATPIWLNAEPFKPIEPDVQFVLF